jgi:DNA-3-methyladenine glycosylase I
VEEGSDGRPRCPWTGDPLLRAYHDEEWGVPVHDDRGHFELISLEGAQAGLSWRTILARRDGYRRLFHGFDPERVARLSAAELHAIAADPAIVRHPGKVQSVVANARAFLAVQEEHGSFDGYMWAFVDGRPLVGRFTAGDQVPATTPLARTVSADLRRRGFGFVGPTIVYAYLQAAGLVMDHLVGCFRFAELAPAGDGAPRS